MYDPRSQEGELMADPRFYSYFFTRQDIRPEQQLVQTAHAALLLGVNSQRGKDTVEVIENSPLQQFGKAIKPAETYFTVVGVRNLDGLMAAWSILEKFGFKYEMFFEPDLNDEPTSIAVYPVHEKHRGPLMAFGLLKM